MMYSRGIAAVGLAIGTLASAGMLAAFSPESAAAEAVPAKVEPIVPDRPDFTDGVLIVVRPQLEAGVTVARTGSERQLDVGEAMLRYPLGERLELRVGLPFYVRTKEDGENDSGFSSSLLSAKYLFVPPDDGRIGIAVLAGAFLPTGSKGVSERGTLPFVKLAFAKEFSERVGLGMNVGWASEKEDGERFNSLFASASLGVELAARLGSFVEVVYFSKVNAAGDDARYIAAGLSYLVTTDLMVDARVGRGVANHFGGVDDFTGVGLSFRF